jgi:hypothetical protein
MRGPFKGAAYNAKSVTHNAPAAECKDLEEECDPEECGDEKRGPNSEHVVCGIDKRPLMPVGLFASTAAGAAFAISQEFPLLRESLNHFRCVEATMLILYAVTLGCMAYCALCDPGQLRKNRAKKAAAAQAESDSTEDGLPARSHKSWQYEFPIRRYDHYCRWLTNCVGLLNHREFVVMVSGLLAISIVGSLLDVFLGYHLVNQGGDHLLFAGIAVHAMFLLGIAHFVGPIFRLHVGFVCRNELVHEWKRNDFYVVIDSDTGHPVSVNELSDDEYNDHFDMFQYDKSRNKFDHGCLTNCAAFWCTARWSPQQLGEF